MDNTNYLLAYIIGLGCIWYMLMKKW